MTATTHDLIEMFRSNAYGRPHYMPRPATVYRMYADDDDLIYVGCSIQTFNRLAGHASSKVWFDVVARIEIERFANKSEALAAEADAIRTERPRYNIAHHPTRRSARRIDLPKSIRHWSEVEALSEMADVER